MNTRRPLADARDVRVSYHEAAHAIASYLFGFRLHLVSIDAGVHFAGITIHASKASAPMSEKQEARLIVPLASALRARLRRLFEESALISLVGPAVDEAVWPRRSGYVRDDDEGMFGLSEPAPVSKHTAARLERADRPMSDDVDEAVKTARVLSPRATVQMLAWLRAEARAMVESPSFGKGFDVLVPALLGRRTLSGAVATRLLKEGGIKW